MFRSRLVFPEGPINNLKAVCARVHARSPRVCVCACGKRYVHDPAIAANQKDTNAAVFFAA